MVSMSLGHGAPEIQRKKRSCLVVAFCARSIQQVPPSHTTSEMRGIRFVRQPVWKHRYSSASVGETEVPPHLSQQKPGY